jgi:hypothetical protein
MVWFPRKAKISLVKGVWEDREVAVLRPPKGGGEDREIAVLGPPKVVGPGLLQLRTIVQNAIY